MDELIERLESAAQKLGVMADGAHARDPRGTGYYRLRGKVDGIRLALSYVREADKMASLASDHG
jgi:hypothetical protein